MSDLSHIPDILVLFKQYLLLDKATDSSVYTNAMFSTIRTTIDFSKFTHINGLKKLPTQLLKDECKNLGLAGDCVTASKALILLCDKYNIETPGHHDSLLYEPHDSSELSNVDLPFYCQLRVSYLQKQCMPNGCRTSATYSWYRCLFSKTILVLDEAADSPVFLYTPTRCYDVTKHHIEGYRSFKIYVSNFYLFHHFISFLRVYVFR